MRIIDDITNFIFVEDIPQKTDIIFIAGGTYPEPAEKAAELITAGFSNLVLPSGKHSKKTGFFPGSATKSEIYNGNYNTEWEFFYNVLKLNGVNPNNILIEDHSECTYENALESKKVTDSKKLKIKKAILCCQVFHARRCLMYYQLAFPETEFLICPAETQGINKCNWFHTSKGVDLVMGELMRCGKQFNSLLCLRKISPQLHQHHLG